LFIRSGLFRNLRLSSYNFFPFSCFEDESLSVDVGTGGDPWDTLASDPFSLSNVSNVYGSPGPMLSDFTHQSMTLATNSEFSSSFVVTCSDNMCPCDGSSFPKTIALDCDVIGVSRLVSDKGCQSYVNVSPVEVPEVDSSTGGRSKDRVGKECVLCCKSFTRLDKHVKYVHGPKKSCFCKEGKGKKGKGVLIRSCRVCNEAFPKYSLLRAHVRVNHPEEIESSGQPALPPCKYCGRKFNSEQKLRDHVVSHSGKYRYQCDMCEKGFAVVTDLQRHRRTHTGDRPYSCELCAKQFTQSGSLNRHKRNVHKIIVPKVE
jgi:uncharacterized Zn-finger protein